MRVCVCSEGEGVYVARVRVCGCKSVCHTWSNRFSSACLPCISRSPGVLGEETLTTI